MASGIEASSIQTLDELYESLNETELNELKPLMKEWEFDLESLKIDIEDEKEGELKNEIDEEFLAKIKSILNGNYNNNEDELSIFKNKLKQKMSNKIAAQIIIDKIEEEDFDMDAIKEEIDDYENSQIYEVLTEKNLAHLNWNEFCNIDNQNNNPSETNNVSHQPHTKSPVKNEYMDEELIDDLQKDYSKQRNNEFENQYKVDKVKVDLKLEQVMTLTKTITNSIAGQIIIDKIKKEEYEFDDIQEDIKDKDNSEIWEALNNQELGNEDDIFNKFKEIINKIDPGVSDKRDYSLKQQQQESESVQDVDKSVTIEKEQETAHEETEEQQDWEPSEYESDEKVKPELKDTQFVDDPNGKLFKYYDHIQRRMNQMNIGVQDVKQDEDQAEALTKIWCIYDPSTVQEMIDLEQLHLAIAFNQSTYYKLHDHLAYYEKETFVELRAEFYKSKVFNRSYSAKHFHPQSLQDLSKALKQYISTRFLGYDKYKGIMNDHKKLIDQIGDDNGDETEDDSEDEDYQVESKINGDLHLYYPVYPVQTFLIGFYIALTKYLLNDSSESTVSVALDVVLPIIKKKDKFNHDIMNRSFEDMIDDVTLKFEHVLKQINYEKQMKRNFICQWKINFDENGNAPIKEPSFIGYSKDDIGFEMNEQEFKKYFKDFQLFEIMRVKRLHKTAEPKDATRFGIGLHKFGKTIKMYIHYAEGFVMRFQLKDISKWFRLLFGNKKWYYQNEINDGIWSKKVSLHLKNLLQDIRNLNDLKPYENAIKLQHDQDDYKRREDCVWKKIEKWTDVDKEFNDKNEKFIQHLLKDPKMRKHESVYSNNIANMKSSTNNGY